MTSSDFRDALEANENDSLGLQDLGGLLNTRFRLRFNLTVQDWPGLCFSPIDQAFLIWGGLTLIIFLTGQFSLTKLDDSSGA